jgi:hypothetical protein
MGNYKLGRTSEEPVLIYRLNISVKQLGKTTKCIILRPQKEVSWMVGMTALEALPFLRAVLFPTSQPKICVTNGG